MTGRSALVIALVLAACGGDDGGKPTIDAPKTVDAPPAAPTVVAETCPATPAATVTTTDGTFMFMPMATTITQGQVVKFTMSLSHNVVPNATGSDPGLDVPAGVTKCLRFTHSGTFGFHCGPHSFTGTVTVN